MFIHETAFEYAGRDNPIRFQKASSFLDCKQNCINYKIP